MKEPRAIIILTNSRSLDDNTLQHINEVLRNCCGADSVMITEVTNEDLVNPILRNFAEKSGNIRIKIRESASVNETSITALASAYDFLSDVCDGAICNKSFPSIPFMIRYHNDATVRECCEILANSDNAVVEEWIHRCKKVADKVYTISAMRQAIYNATTIHNTMN